MKLPTWFTLKPQEKLLSHEDMQNLESTSTPGISYEEVCRHEWVERTRSYAAPNKAVEVGTLDTELAAMLLLGVTTIVDQCMHCGELRQNYILGNPDPQLDELLDKASEYGPQYIEKNGNTYCIQRYFPPAQPVGIPLR